MVHACVFRRRVPRLRNEKKLDGRGTYGGEGEAEGGEGWRGGGEGGGRPRRHPYNEERGRGKKGRLICRPRTSPIRVLFVPPAIFLYYPSLHPRGVYLNCAFFHRGRGGDRRKDESFLGKGIIV